MTFAFGYLAILGIPPFSGFFSKDHIIEVAFAENTVVGLCALLGAGITAFYMTRLMMMTFFGEKRWEEDVHPHESPKVMTGPLIILAILSLVGGALYFVGHWIVKWLEPVTGFEEAHPPIGELAMTPDHPRGRDRRRCHRSRAVPPGHPARGAGPGLAGHHLRPP